MELVEIPFDMMKRASGLNSAAKAIKTTQRELSKLLLDARMEQEQEKQHERKDEDEDDDASEQKEGSWMLRQETNQWIELTRRLRLTEDRVEELEKELEVCRQSRRDALDQVNDLKDQADQLRGLLTESMRQTEQHKHKTKQAEGYLKSLSGVTKDMDQLLSQSTPPASFQAYKVDPTHATELETTKARLKQARDDLQKLQNKVEKLTNEKTQTKIDTRKQIKEAEELLATKHAQLLGALRRIHYLVEQNNQYQTTVSKKDAYIQQLEDKLLQLNRELNQARVTSSPEQQQHEKADRKYFLSRSPNIGKVNWDSVFRQSKLDQTPRTTTTRKKIVTSKEIIDEKFSQWMQQQQQPSSSSKEWGVTSDNEDEPVVEKETRTSLSRFEQLLADEVSSEESDQSDDDEEQLLHDEWLNKVGAT